MFDHIVIINHNAGSPYHGPNFRSYYAALGLVKKGYKVTIVCSSFSHKLKQYPTVRSEFNLELIDDIQYIWIKTSPYYNKIGRLYNYFQFYYKLKKLHLFIKGQIDYIICSSPPPLWIWFCLSFAKMKKAILFFEARDLWPDVIIETTKYGQLNPISIIMKIAEKTAYLKSDHVISVNENAIKIMSKRGLSPNRFSHIPNGVPIINRTKNKDKMKYQNICSKLKKGGWFIVGYSGALSKVYGLHYLAEASRILQNEKVAFILAGTGEYEEELRQMTKDLNNFHFIGWINKQYLQDYLGLVDICFAGLLNIPSFTYGSDSTKLYEYMNARKPIIHSISNKNSLVEKAQCGVRVQAEDSNSIADGILKLKSKDSETLKTIGQNGYTYLIKNNTYEVITRRWIELINSYSQNKLTLKNESKN